MSIMRILLLIQSMGRTGGTGALTGLLPKT
jgi:hypothetical protein